MRRILALLLGASVLTASAQAALLTLTVNQTTGEAWIENKSAETIIFDGYQITSAGKHLSVDNWRSFQDWINADPTTAKATLGNLSWGEFVTNPDSLVETNLAAETTANPGFKVAIGTPVTQFLANDLGFFFSDFTKPAAQRNTVGLIDLVGSNPHPWQNGTNPLDTDNSGGDPVALDALVVINALNDGGARALPVPPVAPNLPPPFLDVNGDDQLSPLDALMVINHLNSVAGAQAVPEPSTGVLAVGGLGALLVMGGGYGWSRRRQRLAVAKAARSAQ